MAELNDALLKQAVAAVKILAAGGLVAFPTDTVYGVGAKFDSIPAVERVFAVKKRPYSSALPLIMADEAQLDMVAVNVSPLARELARRFWPGELTLIVPRSAAVPDAVTSGGDSVAVRVSGHPLSRWLAAELGAPIVGTSANLHGRPSPVTAAEVRAQLGDGVDMIIDGGACRYGRESTIIDVSGDMPKIVRPGVVTRAEIEKICGRVD
jgi:L-threonylcarbamoyladenylate synthase